MEGDGEGGGERPGSCGPDDGVDLAAGEVLVDSFRSRSQLVADVDGGTGVLLVFDLGFSEGGAVVDAPVDRLEPAIDEAAFQEAVKRVERTGLIGTRHGLIWLVPAAEAADALELGGLEVDVFLCVGPACI